LIRSRQFFVIKASATWFSFAAPPCSREIRAPSDRPPPATPVLPYFE
jgi:hypothetical protein